MNTKVVGVRLLVVVAVFVPYCVAAQSWDVVVAAADTPAASRSAARFVCDTDDARPVLQKAIDEADWLGVKCILLRGTYQINSRGERNSRGGICFWNPERKERFYGQMKARYHVLEGAKEPLGWYDGAIVTMGRKLYESLSDDEPFSLFYSAGNSIFARGLIVRNLVVRLPGGKKPVIVFDGRFSGALRYEDCWVSALDPRKVDWATAEGVEVPNPLSAGFRGCCGSNIYTTEWKNLVAMGFGTGFDIGGEHVYCESLSALYNLYGFAFDCYKGRHSIDEKESAKACGGCFYPVYCVNLLDEHNVHMPRFGVASHDGEARDNWAQSITIRGMNVQWPNSAPGYTDRRAPDFTKGRHRATETVPGSWRGSIEYAIDHTTPGGGVNLTGEPFFEIGHGTHVTSRNLTTGSEGGK